MQAQAFSDPSKAQYLLARKTMEINPRHPIIAELNARAEAEAEAGAADEETTDLANVLYDTALLSSGFSIDDAPDFATRMYRLMKAGLKLESLASLPEAELPAEVRALHELGASSRWAGYAAARVAPCSVRVPCHCHPPSFPHLHQVVSHSPTSSSCPLQQCACAGGGGDCR